MLGIFDSGFGGLSVLKHINNRLPNISTVFLGDNAQAPYGTRSTEEIFQLTLKGVRFLFQQGCPLVILACNTASAEALRRIQQEILPVEFPDRRVLGVIRPASEHLHERYDGDVGILATPATIRSESYAKEVAKLAPNTSVSQVACPGLVELIEQGKCDSEQTNELVSRYTNTLIEMNPQIEYVLLACTHYPLIYDVFRKQLPDHIKLISQGNIVADKLKEYLDRNKSILAKLNQDGQRLFYTTTSIDLSDQASMFYQSPIQFTHTSLQKYDIL